MECPGAGLGYRLIRLALRPWCDPKGLDGKTYKEGSMVKGLRAELHFSFYVGQPCLPREESILAIKIARVSRSHL